MVPRPNGLPFSRRKRDAKDPSGIAPSLCAQRSAEMACSAAVVSLLVQLPIELRDNRTAGFLRYLPLGIYTYRRQVSVGRMLDQIAIRHNMAR